MALLADFLAVVHGAAQRHDPREEGRHGVEPGDAECERPRHRVLVSLPRLGHELSAAERVEVVDGRKHAMNSKSDRSPKTGSTKASMGDAGGGLSKL